MGTPEKQANMENSREIPTNNSALASNTSQENSNKLICELKQEKPGMPCFSGDVCDYIIFPANFRHAVNSRYRKWTQFLFCDLV